MKQKLPFASKIKPIRVKESFVPIHYIYSGSFDMLKRFDTTKNRLKIKPVIVSEANNYRRGRKDISILTYEVVESGEILDQIQTFTTNCPPSPYKSKYKISTNFGDEELDENDVMFVTRTQRSSSMAEFMKNKAIIGNKEDLRHFRYSNSQNYNQLDHIEHGMKRLKEIKHEEQIDEEESLLSNRDDLLETEIEIPTLSKIFKTSQFKKLSTIDIKKRKFKEKINFRRLFEKIQDVDDSLSEDIDEAEAENQLKELKGKKFFSVPKSMMTNRYVSILKLIKSKRDKLEKSDFEKYCMLGIIQPNLNYLKEMNNCRQNTKTLDVNSWNKNCLKKQDDQLFSQYIEKVIKINKKESTDETQRMKKKLDISIEHILDRAHKLYET